MIKLGAGMNLPDWTDGIELSDEDHEAVLNLIRHWNDEFFFIEKHKEDAFIIYGHVQAQRDIENEILLIFKKYRIHGIN